MTISYYGGQCIELQEKERGEETRSVVVLPHTKTSKTRTLEKKANVVLTETDAPTLKNFDGFRIDTPGEYDVSRFAIRGVSAAEALVYVVDGPKLTFGYITPDSVRDLDEKELEQIGTVDILAVPMPFREKNKKEPETGLGHFIRSVEPKIVIVMADAPKLYKAAASELGTDLKQEKKLVASVRDLPEEGFRLVQLEAQ